MINLQFNNNDNKKKIFELLKKFQYIIMFIRNVCHAMVPGTYYKTNHEINKYFNYLLISIVSVFIAGIITYGEKFRLREYTYSYIGMLHTPGGYSNTTAFLFFLAGSLFNSIMCFKISALYREKIYRILFGVCGAGFLLLMIPCDVLNTVHSYGGAAVFGSLWVLSLFRIYDIYHSGNARKAITCFLFLNITILPYACLYFINSTLQNIAQKPAIIGLILTVKIVFSEIAGKHAGGDLKKEALQ